jgi:hypothetical protein
MTRFLKKHFLFLYALLTVLASPTVSAQTLTFARNEKLPEQDISQAIFLQMMKNLRIPASVVSLPPARANLNNINLQMSGEIARIDSYGVANPKLIRVEPSHYSLTSVAFIKINNNISIASAADLHAYKVGHIHGVQHSLDLVRGIPNVERANDSTSLFNMLDANRFEIAITTGIDGEIALHRLKLEDKIIPIATLGTRPLYIYLNDRSKHLANAMGAEIGRMKETGEMDKIIKRESEKLRTKK